MRTDRNDDKLIAGYLSGEISEEERELYYEKLQSDSQFREKAGRYQEVWSQASQLSVPAGVPASARWSNIEKAISREPVMVKAKERKLHLWPYAAAVALLVAVAASFFWMEMNSAEVHFATGDGERKQVELPDGSLVSLNVQSELAFAYVRFGSRREAELKGEAYFEVAKSDSPFLLRVGQSQIQVVGTAFNVRHYNKEVLVACSEGRVRVVDAAGQSQLLTRGFGISVSEQGLSNLYEIDPELAGLWRSGKLYFRETPLPEVFSELERYFGVRVEISSSLDNLTFSGKFDHPELEETLKIICLSAGLQFEVAPDGTVKIR